MSGLGRFSLPLTRPMETAQGTFARREGFLVRIGDGPVGIGEASPLPGSTESMAACRATLEEWIDSAEDMESADELPAMPATPAARHGLELALLDRSARAGAVPLYRHLGGERRISTVPATATVGDGEIASTVADSRSAVAEGFRSLTVTVGARPVDEDLDRLRAVRDAVGDLVELRADAHGSWSPEQAAIAIEDFAELGVSIVEQPLERADLGGHATLRHRGVAIALDESLCEHEIDAVVDADAADALVLKPMVLGGIGRAAQFADRARTAGVEVLVGSTVDAAVARTAAVHLAAAIDGERACALATADWFAQDVGSDPAAVVDGSVSVPQGAGHDVGVEALD